MHDTSLWSLWHARHRHGLCEVGGLGQLLMKPPEERLLRVGSIPQVMGQGVLLEVRHLPSARP